jgi:putative transposase
LTDAVAALDPASGLTQAACLALGVSRASAQRRRARLNAPPRAAKPRPRPRRGLTDAQRQAVLDLLHEPRFADQAPAEIYATLLDEGVYHCSIRTMYRILGDNSEVRERRAQLRHPAYQKPELLAERPNQVWSWDITKLMGPTKWSYFYLYVIIDIFSRRVVGWCVADTESAALFKPLFDDAVVKHAVPPGQLTLHADRGGPMKAKHAPAKAGGDGAAAGRPGRHQVPQPPACVERQSVLGEPLQDAQIPADVPEEVRLHRGRQGVLPMVLQLV